MRSTLSLSASRTNLSASPSARDAGEYVYDIFYYRPSTLAEQAAAAAAAKRTKPVPTAARPSARTQEITFRSIVEEYAASHNLLFIPSGKAHELSRLPLFRVSRTADNKGGILVYILDDAVWAAAQGTGSEKEVYKAVSLEEMVARASAS